MYVSTDIIKKLIKDHYEALAAKTCEQFADSPLNGMETLARQTLQRINEEKTINEFEIIARFYINKQ